MMERPIAWRAVTACLTVLLLCQGAAAWVTFIEAEVNSTGEARDVATDSAGDVLTVGMIPGLTAVKLDGGSGSEIWQQTIEGTDTGPGQGRAILYVPAPTNAVVVAGSVPNAGTDKDFLVVGLSPTDGSEVWRTALNGSSGSGDEATALAAFQGGDVVAAGRLDNVDTFWDFTVARLAGADGAELWRYERNGSADQSEEALAVAVDPSGDVVAAGYLRNLGKNTDLTVVKLAGGTGAELWRREITGSKSGADKAVSVAIDAAGDVLVAGYVANAGTNRDAAVIKLSGSDGSTTWQSDVDGGASASDQAVTVVLGSGGEVFAAANLEGSAGADVAVIALNGSNGDELWTYRLDGSGGGLDTAHDLVVGLGGDPVVVGMLTEIFTSRDLVVARIDASDGSEVWRQVINGKADKNDEALAVALGPEGALFVGGGSWRFTTRRFFKRESTGIGREADPSRELTVLRIDGETGGQARLLAGRRFRMIERNRRKRNVRLNVSSGDRLFLGKDGVAAPPRGSPSDPRSVARGGTGAGGELVILNPSSGEIARIPLPAENWEAVGPPNRAQGYEYRDRNGSEGPCSRVDLSTKKGIRIKCKGPEILFTLDEQSQGSLSALLIMGETPVGYCVHFGGRVRRDRGTTGWLKRGSFASTRADPPLECSLDELP